MIPVTIPALRERRSDIPVLVRHFIDKLRERTCSPVRSVGETALLLNYTHQPADNPYRASHAIFVHEGAERRYDAIDTVPAAMQARPLSIRAFDAGDLMVDADLVDGPYAAGLIERLFGDPRVAYLHAHYARRGCYAARIERV